MEDGNTHCQLEVSFLHQSGGYPACTLKELKIQLKQDYLENLWILKEVFYTSFYLKQPKLSGLIPTLDSQMKEYNHSGGDSAI